MGESSAADITHILRDWNAGDESAPERLLPAIYAELRALGAHYLRGERSDHTLQATALVHEAYIKMSGEKRVASHSRAHFARLAARAMRQVLVEHARAHKAAKRAGNFQKVYLDETRELGAARNPDLLELEQALQSFAALYPRKAEVVELKFFAGLGIEAVADALNVSTKTVKRDWTFARAWLCRELTDHAA